VNWETFLDHFCDWLATRGLLVNGARWVVGASGGPDSTLLLHAMSAASQQRNLGWGLHAAHLHHGLRGADADADEAFVSRQAESLPVTIHRERIQNRAQVAQHGGSTEEVARQRRYDFLERVALMTGSECVAVAHHADDNAETVLHRICRGTGLRGLRGMSDTRPVQPGSRVRLVRPLLQTARATIEELCRSQGFEARQDSSNSTAEFTRGRIRNIVLPHLRENLNPNVTDALLRLAEQARWLGTYLEDAAERTFESLLISESPRHIVINTRALLAKQKIIQAEVVRRAISLVLGGEQDVGFSHVDAVLRLAADKASGKELHLPGAVLARKQYERLEFRPLTDAGIDAPWPELIPVFIACPGRTPLPSLGGELISELCQVDPGRIDALREAPNPFEEWVDFERLRPPLLVRGRRDGDRFRPLGAPGAKTLSEFLGDEKVDPQLRARTGVLFDQDGPVWVIPLRIDERVKLRATTRRALRLTFMPAAAGQAPAQ
jgi:tRNA(Ile)-lysidine synthase